MRELGDPSRSAKGREGPSRRRRSTARTKTASSRADARLRRARQLEKDRPRALARRQAPAATWKSARPPRSLRSPHLLRELNDRSRDGGATTLALDRAIQRVAEGASTPRSTETKGASLVVMDPTIGRHPRARLGAGYNPNDYGEADADSRRDRAVTDRFEPGSVARRLFTSSQRSRRAMKPTEQIFCEHGNLSARQRHDPRHARERHTHRHAGAGEELEHGALKMTSGSASPGLWGLSQVRLRRADRPPDPGRGRSGVLRPRAVQRGRDGRRELRQNISVTTVQLATAMSAIANGGR